MSQSWKDNLCLRCIDLCLRKLNREQQLNINIFPDYALLLEEVQSYYVPLYSEKEEREILSQRGYAAAVERIIQTQLFLDHQLPEDSAGDAWRAAFDGRKEKEKEKQKEKKKRQKEKRKGKGMMP